MRIGFPSGNIGPLAATPSWFPLQLDECPQLLFSQPSTATEHHRNQLPLIDQLMDALAREIEQPRSISTWNNRPMFIDNVAEFVEFLPAALHSLGHFDRRQVRKHFRLIWCRHNRFSVRTRGGIAHWFCTLDEEQGLGNLRFPRRETHAPSPTD